AHRPRPQHQRLLPAADLGDPIGNVQSASARLCGRRTGRRADHLLRGLPVREAGQRHRLPHGFRPFRSADARHRARERRSAVTHLTVVGPVCEHMFVRCDASILHADLDSFYASVEQRDDPTLRGRPVIVGGGVVLAASYEAKAYGVRTAMGGAQARRLCPHAVVVPPRMSAYSRASDAVFEVFRDCTPIVEPLSVDEAFLDDGGLRRVSGTTMQIGARLRADVRARVGLPITVGIARTKFLAKVASQEAKPDGLLLVPPDEELTFLHPLPVRRLWGVGVVTADKLRNYGITTVAEVAELSESTLASLLGAAMGRQLYALSRNLDRRRVTTGVHRRSV